MPQHSILLDYTWYYRIKRKTLGIVILCLAMYISYRYFEIFTSPAKNLNSFQKHQITLVHTLDPIVNVLGWNLSVGSLNYIFHPNMILIYCQWHKFPAYFNKIFIDKFPLFWIRVKDLQEYLRLSCSAISMGAIASDSLANF